MAQLRRLASGDYTVQNASTIAEIAARAVDGSVGSLLLPVDSVFAELEMLTVGEQEAFRIRCGGIVPADGEDRRVRVYSHSGEFLMVGRAENGLLKTEKSFFEVS